MTLTPEIPYRRESLQDKPSNWREFYLYGPCWNLVARRSASGLRQDGVGGLTKGKSHERDKVKRSTTEDQGEREKKSTRQGYWLLSRPVRPSRLSSLPFPPLAWSPLPARTASRFRP